MIPLKVRLVFVGIFAVLASVYGQIQQTDWKHLLQRYYPAADQPGAVLMISQGGHEISVGRGVRSLETSMELDIQSNFRMASVSKQYTAWATAHLIEQQGVAMNESIGQYFPELGPQAEAITVAQLINHTSGIPDYETRMPLGLQKPLSDADVLGLISPLDTLYFQPGTRFRYSNTAYCLLTLLVERISHTPYADYLQEHLFDELALSGSTVYQASKPIVHRAYGYHVSGDQYTFADQSLTSSTKGDGGIYTSATDFHRFVRYHQQFLQDRPDLIKGLTAVSEGVDYGMGLFQAQTNQGQHVFFHSGETTGFRQIFLSVPEQDLVISLFTNRDDLKISSLFDEVMKRLDLEIPPLQDASLFSWLSDVYNHQQ